MIDEYIRNIYENVIIFAKEKYAKKGQLMNEGKYKCKTLLDISVMEYTEPSRAILSVAGEMQKAYKAYSEGYLTIDATGEVLLFDKNNVKLASWKGKTQNNEFYIEIDGEICPVVDGVINIGVAEFELITNK